MLVGNVLLYGGYVVGGAVVGVGFDGGLDGAVGLDDGGCDELYVGMDGCEYG